MSIGPLGPGGPGDWDDLFARFFGAAEPRRALSPSPTWYPIVMTVILIIGLAYLVTYYLASDKISFMNNLGAWNFAVGFGILVAGLIMAVR